MENLSLFDIQSEEVASTGDITGVGDLNVVVMDFLQAKKTTWQELFSNFDSLYAITFSSGIGFVCKLLENFESAEIIFGCEPIISYTLQEVMAFQSKLVDNLKSGFGAQQENLISKIEDGSLRLYAAREQLSHEKIYLLSAKDGRKRVIMGSANMSFNAFGGKQRENIAYIDGDAAFDWYMDQYQELKEKSTDRIEKSAILVADSGEHLDELPISRTVRIQKAVVIQPQSEEQKETIKFALDVKSLAGKFATAVPKPDKKGKLMISPEKIKTIKRQVVSDIEREKELRSEYPQLEVNTNEKNVFLNGQEVNLHPSKAEISHDVELFLRYMDGYKNFHGDVNGLQRRYYEFANWFFCSPFMGVMRDTAVRYNQNTLPYPVFGLVYGQSKAGKTSFLETLLKMMIGQKTKLSAPDFTRSSIENLKRTVKGAPIRELSLEDYFSERVTGRYAIRAIQTAWRTDRQAFHVSPRANELWYTAPTPYEIDRILKELPETLVPKRSGNRLIMKLDVACDFFEIPFKRKRILDVFRLR